MSSPRYLTKSRFRLALECATKLHYSGQPGMLDTSLEDSFLAALAEGGYQVGALACLMHPGGVAVEERDHARALAVTHELLQRDEVTIYEAALEARGLFVRVDILRKRGRRIELIKVKAKSYRPETDRDFRDASGALAGGFLPYLQDIAFQRHVAALARPEAELHAYLMLADKSVAATVDGLNQRFKVRRRGRDVAIELSPGTDSAVLGEPILRTICVDEQVAEILAGELRVAGQALPFADAVDELASAYRDQRRIDTPPGSACARCDFKAARPPREGEPRSGFHECWKRAFGWHDEDFRAGTVLDLWNFRRKDELIGRGVARLQDVSAEDIGFDGSEPGDEGMSVRQRQWYQRSGQWPGGGAFWFDRDRMAAEMARWCYPLHFIDFETAAVPIPFTRGRRPYETLAFQFSHHVMHADGRVEHAHQFLEARPGVDPNEAFVRALRDALGSDSGTVLRWAAHENTVLNQLRRELLPRLDARPELAELVRFIDTLVSRSEGDTRHVGERHMVDLCKLAERYFFHPATRGSSSLKRVLPALMASSQALRERYGEAVYAAPAMPSLNFEQPMRWWQMRDGQVLDPYKLLPPIFGELSADEQEALDVGLAPELAQGGAALAAYACLQSEVITPTQRAAIEGALLRYCELDTLAMVMAVQDWQGGRPPSLRGLT